MVAKPEIGFPHEDQGCLIRSTDRVAETEEVELAMGKGHVIPVIGAGARPAPIPGSLIARNPVFADRHDTSHGHGHGHGHGVTSIGHTLQPLMDRLSAPAALLAADGLIFLTNQAWDQLCDHSEGLARGSNYFERVLNDAGRGDADSSAILSSLVELLAGNQSHSHVGLQGQGLAGGKTAGVNLTLLPFKDAYYILVHRPEPPIWAGAVPDGES